ncbi:MAG: FAD:protein FMN transferase [Bacteroidales bacterium]|nr:FAD:protein FMN transferase [Bacteroidales bacterium]
MKAILLPLLILAGSCTYNNRGTYFFAEGGIQGTSYHITYQSPDSIDYSDSITRILHEFDLSLSSYIPNSIISGINRNDNQVTPDKYFTDVYKKSEEVYHASKGLFDITVAPLVNAWGFGPDKSMAPDSTKIDSLMVWWAMTKSILTKTKFAKYIAGIKLDFSAVAKGYAVDVVAKYLEDKGIEDLLVEIGGELICKGTKPDGQPWRTAIEDPQVGAYERKVLSVVQLTDRAVATRQLPQLLCSRWPKVCTHHQPCHRISHSTQPAECLCICRQLHDCRCICHGLYGNGRGKKPKLY